MINAYKFYLSLGVLAVFRSGYAGYGTAVAIPIGILIALGFDPLKQLSLH